MRWQSVLLMTPCLRWALRQVAMVQLPAAVLLAPEQRPLQRAALQQPPLLPAAAVVVSRSAPVWAAVRAMPLPLLKRTRRRTMHRRCLRASPLLVHPRRSCVQLPVRLAACGVVEIPSRGHPPHAPTWSCWQSCPGLVVLVLLLLAGRRQWRSRRPVPPWMWLTMACGVSRAVFWSTWQWRGCAAGLDVHQCCA